MSTATLEQPTVLHGPTDEPDDVYHADADHTSASMLKKLAESPQEFQQLFITREMQQPDTEAMKFGRMFHCWMLERDTFASRFPSMPAFELDADNKTKAGKPSQSKSTEYYQAKSAEFMAACAGKTISTHEHHDLLTALETAIYRHDEARELIEADGPVEHVIRWHDKIARKARLDKIVSQMNCIPDIKTMNGKPTPQRVSRAMAEFNWSCQAAWYREAVAVATGEHLRVLFIVVNKEPPHEVAIHELTEDDMDWAEKRNEELVAELVARRRDNDWRAAWQRGICSTPLPQYVKSTFWEVE
jgi:hypothetical protein